MTKILLVEDDKSLREIYGVRLLAEGYDIVSAGDGEEALAMAIKERPNLIVSDVMMPKISGFDMLDILRSTTETRGIKVIMMTALSSDDQRKRGEMLGADRYLVKSQVGIEDVVRTVHEVLGDGHLTPEERTANKSLPTADENQPANQPTSEPVLNIAENPTYPQPYAEMSAQPTVQNPQPATFTAPPRVAPVQRGSFEVPARDTRSFDQRSYAQAPFRPQPQIEQMPPVDQTQNLPSQNPVELWQVQDNSVESEQTQNQDVSMATFAPSPSSLPQPTAPFSTNRPNGLGERVIQPLERDATDEDAFAEKMNNILSGFSADGDAPNDLTSSIDDQSRLG